MTVFVKAMLDTTKLLLCREQAGFNLEACLQYLTNLSENYRQDTGQTYITGNAGNLRVSLSEHWVTIVGSLPKFYTGTNLHTLSRPDCRRAFEKMADTLHLPVQQAKVTRLDVGLNLITDHRPELYYPYFGQSRYYTRLTQPKSITYQNNLRSKKLYNKIAESKSKGMPIPEIYAGKNVLRYEVCYMQRLNKEFKQAFITPDTITEESFYVSLIDRWCNEYEAIQKIGAIKMNTSKIKSPKDYMKQVIALALQEKGLDMFLHHVDQLKELKTFDKPEYYSRIRSELKRLSNITTIADTPELILELNQKISRVREYYQ